MKTISFFCFAFVRLSIFRFLYVSVLAFISPQQVIDLVQVQLTNTDAVSRLITISIDGTLGAFGTQWLMIESAFCVLGAVPVFSAGKLQSA